MSSLHEVSDAAMRKTVAEKTLTLMESFIPVPPVVPMLDSLPRKA